jgi:tRNA threonylcarbamoyladenosine dehydratase
MAPNNSKWWQAPNEADLDYGFDSNDLDTRFAEPKRNQRPTPTNETRERSQASEAQGSSDENRDRGVVGNMSDWLSRQVGSHNSQLAATAVFSGAAVASAIFGYQTYRRKEAVYDLKASIPVADEQHPSERVCFFSFAGNIYPGSLAGIQCAN